jgi:hypothetical protein
MRAEGGSHVTEITDHPTGTENVCELLIRQEKVDEKSQRFIRLYGQYLSFAHRSGGVSRTG